MDDREEWKLLNGRKRLVTIINPAVDGEYHTYKVDFDAAGDLDFFRQYLLGRDLFSMGYRQITSEPYQRRTGFELWFALDGEADIPDISVTLREKDVKLCLSQPHYLLLAGKAGNLVDKILQDTVTAAEQETSYTTG